MPVDLLGKEQERLTAETEQAERHLEQRDGLYELVRNHLGSIGDIWIALEKDGEYMLAEQMGIEFSEDFRLLADLGWEP